MTSDFTAGQRRHNPVDSICRKIQTIQRRDQEANSPFQIPKFQSRNYDSPQTSLKRNLEAILKKRTVRNKEGDSLCFRSPGMEVMTPNGSAFPLHSANGVSPANATYTILSLTGERRPWQIRPWSRSCSTPTSQTGENYFSFSKCSTYSRAEDRSSSLDRNEGNPVSRSVHLYSSPEKQECDRAYQALVVKRLSMGEGTGNLLSSRCRKDNASEISLICEEDLLDTIFHACDTQRRGKVSVSRIVDYLRHTTSRESEDSGLEELCNMLDPEHRDISIDLETYHAIMREWIDDCRNHGDETTAEGETEDSQKLSDSLSARKSFAMNMTVGSLEAFGGEVSRGDLETSDLVYCVADLQFNNQKLQDEVRKLKLAVDTMEETNNKLMEENEDLKTQAKSGQQSAMKEKLLKEELEEMKVTLNNMEENRARSAAQNKQMERENQSLISKIASLQEENIKNMVDIDHLQKKMAELCAVNADLQMQVHSLDNIVGEKEALLCEKNAQIQELKSTIEEYSSVTDLLRAEKNKLESHVEMLQPALGLDGMSLSGAYRLNQSTTGSLQTELALAQQAPEAPAAVSMSAAPYHAPLDETLDRDVFLLLQGPASEQTSGEFKAVVQKLHQDFREDICAVMCTLKRFTENHIESEDLREIWLKTINSELEEKRNVWLQRVQLLDQCKCSLEEELIKVASRLRRCRTEAAHLKKELSARLPELEAQKQLQRDDKPCARPERGLAEAASQTESSAPQVADKSTAASLLWEDESLLRNDLQETLHERVSLQDNSQALALSCGQFQQRLEEKQEKGSILIQSFKCHWELKLHQQMNLLTKFSKMHTPYSHLLTIPRALEREAQHPPNHDCLSLQHQSRLDCLSPIFGLGEETGAPSKKPRQTWGEHTNSMQIATSGPPVLRGSNANHCTPVPSQIDTTSVNTMNTDALTLDLLYLYPKIHNKSSRIPRSAPQYIESLPGQHPSGQLALSDTRRYKLSVGVQVEDGLTVSIMTDAKELSVDQLPVAATEAADSANHASLPLEKTAQVSPSQAGMSDGVSGGEDAKLAGGIPPQIQDCETSSPTKSEKPEDGNGNAALNTGLPGGSPSTVTESLGPCGIVPKKDTAMQRSKFRKNLEHTQSMAAIAEHKPQEEQSDSTQKEVPTESAANRNKSPNQDKNMRAEFQPHQSVSCSSGKQACVLGMGKQFLMDFYHGTIESALTSGITVWYSDTAKHDRDKLQGVVATAQRIIGGDLPSIGEIHTIRCRNKAQSISQDPNHLATSSPLPFGKSFSPSEKEVETEFHRLSLGFKCDVFTLEKRLRLEERSRDLAEENLKKEVKNCKGLLEKLVPLCEDDNQSIEIIQRLQKNFDVLIQSMSRVSSRSEMLGAIHQESRVSKAVEVMIQHVENLKRMYTKEHAELLELKETLVQSERSFGSYSERDDLRKKTSGSQYSKPSSRRVSVPAISRNIGNASHFEMPKLHEISETEADKLCRRSGNWRVLAWPLFISSFLRVMGMKQNSARPTLQRFVSSCPWAESDEPSLMKGYEQESESPPAEEKREEIVERKSSLTEMGNKISSVLMTSTTCDQISSRLADFRHSVSKSNRGMWISVVLTVLFAAFIGLIASFAFQPSVDAAPVGTGDSWVAIQQFLWPYTGLRHNGQPPV
ncbi:LRMP protein, partial [Atractosteus spatula]|nr:LRMP protein [Atractosteus spatula]